MIYISGPISGVTDYLKIFNEAYIELVLNGYLASDIVNPAKNKLVCNSSNLSWKQYMDIDLLWLSYCDEIYMLRNWENSKGAKLEHEYALANNYKIIYQK